MPANPKNPLAGDEMAWGLGVGNVSGDVAAGVPSISSASSDVLVRRSSLKLELPVGEVSTVVPAGDNCSLDALVKAVCDSNGKLVTSSRNRTEVASFSK